MDRFWELLLLDAEPPVDSLGALVTGDLDGGGHVEVIIGGEGGLLWYRPQTFEKGIVARGQFGVGLALEDLDDDGVLEVVVGQVDPVTSRWTIVWFEPGQDLSQPWSRHVLDPRCNGHAHDLLFCDLDGDGQREMVANATYCEVPGLFVYKRPGDVAQFWPKHTVGLGIFGEGLAAADLDGDGRVEIVHGPDWYNPPLAGPFSGPWRRQVYAPGFREMSRTVLVDITGTGRPDVVIAESEYPDGRVSWFENCLGTEVGRPWIEHELERGVNFAHSLHLWNQEGAEGVRVLLAEMAAGGWDQPYNWNARLITYATADGGRTWQREVLYRGAGTHQAVVCDVDGDGEVEIVGKEWGQARGIPKVQIWRQRETPAPLARFRHRFLDRDKPYTATDILATDVDGDGRPDVVCGAWWYQAPTWTRYDIPGIYQVHQAYDLDGDGRQELIATRRSGVGGRDWYKGLSSEFCWLKPLDPVEGRWQVAPIGRGSGDWPHGTAVAPLLPGGGLAFVASYHSAHARRFRRHSPELFEVPDDPRHHPWPRRVLAKITYGEELVPHDITGDGQLDLVAGCWWLENRGDGSFRPHRITRDFYPARVAVADINGNDRPDVVLGEEALDFKKRVTPWSRLAWFECPPDPRSSPWPMHVVDKLRCPHSVAVADLDGDGSPEIVCGEHDPFRPYRSRCRLLVYKRAEPGGRAWFQYVLDDRFEHHDGAKVVELAPGRTGIISHGWQDSRYVHLWEPEWQED